MRVVSVMPLYPPATQALTASRKAGTHGAVRSFEVTSRRSACALSGVRSEEHTSELQSQSNLVCRLLLEKKKNTNPVYTLLNRLTRSFFPHVLSSTSSSVPSIIFLMIHSLTYATIAINRDLTPSASSHTE